VSPTAERATPDDIMAVLRGVIDPELGANIVELGMVPKTSLEDDGTAHVTIALTTMGCPLRSQIKKDVVGRVEQLPGVDKVKIDWTELEQGEKAEVMARARKRVAENPPDNEISPSTPSQVKVSPSVFSMPTFGVIQFLA
jgi:ATP-binding protein involved in chromosome partitioning